MALDVRMLLVSLRLMAVRAMPRHCEAPGCSAATCGGKPFCSDHVELNDHARRVVAAVARREDEVRQLEQRGQRAARGDMLVLGDLVHCLACTNGGATVERMVRYLHLSERVVLALVGFLRSQGIVTTTATARGSTFVALASKHAVSA